jgi:hypothetical protein
MERPADMNKEVAKIAYVLFLMMMTMGRKCPDMIRICVIYIGHDRNKRHWVDRAMRSRDLFQKYFIVYILCKILFKKGSFRATM